MNVVIIIIPDYFFRIVSTIRGILLIACKLKFFSGKQITTHAIASSKALRRNMTMKCGFVKIVLLLGTLELL